MLPFLTFWHSVKGCCSFQHYFTAGNADIHTFLEFCLLAFCTILVQSLWLLSHLTVVETMASSERGMDLAAMTIINSRKKIGQAKD